MKKCFLIVFLGIVSISIYAQNHGYRYQSEFITLTPNDQTTFLIKNNSSNASISFERGLYETLSKEYTDVYLSKMYTDKFGNSMYVLPLIGVSLKEGFSVNSILTRFSGLITLEESLDSVFYLDCKAKRSDDILKIVSEIDKMDGVEWCQPDFVGDITPANQYYDYQWYVNGNCNYGINVLPVWSKLSLSSDITVAVIDMGVDQNHEDMSSCVLDGYTAEDSNGRGAPKNPNNIDSKYHGMACAGIIAAIDNNIGIKGVAHGVKILPVNIFPHEAYIREDLTIYHGASSSSEIAKAILWASERADILSCSWSGAYNNFINSAIQYALQYGRNGKGCIVVASSGNNYPTDLNVAFPANADGVISVGATQSNGTICTFSQRGDILDIVAPGLGIYSTDRMGSNGNSSDNYLSFSGTSASCPQVSATAALMLSSNSLLTASEVRSILQNSARDLGPLGKDATFGYGLLDADAAVFMASAKILGDYFLCGSNEYVLSYDLDGSVVSWSLSGSEASNFSLASFGHHCTITRNSGAVFSSNHFFLTLTATISSGGTIVKTLTKSLLGNTGFSPTYSETENVDYSSGIPVFTPAISETPVTNPNEVYVYKGGTVRVKSGYFWGKEISYTGPCDLFHFIGRDEFRFILRNDASTSNPFIVTVHENGCDDEKTFRFYPLSYSPYYTPHVVRLNEDEYRISLMTEEDLLARNVSSKEKDPNNIPIDVDVHDVEWTVEASEVITGRGVFSVSIKGTDYVLDTKSWKRGIYVLRIKVDDKVVYSCKIEV